MEKGHSRENVGGITIGTLLRALVRSVRPTEEERRIRENRELLDMERLFSNFEKSLEQSSCRDFFLIKEYLDIPWDKSLRGRAIGDCDGAVFVAEIRNEDGEVMGYYSSFFGTTIRLKKDLEDALEDLQDKIIRKAG